MQEALTWLVVLLIIGGAFWALVRESDRQKKRTIEEYERDLANSKNSLLRAGLLQLDTFSGEAKQKQAAVEFLKDEEQGMTKTGGRDDDSDRTASQR